jgi:multicomponent Na+:H+ antiporter subunit G
MRNALGQAGLLAGSALILVAAVGVVRFPDALTRMHALAKASTAGVSLALVSTAVAATAVNDLMSLLFAAALQAATNPVASTLLTQSAYYAGAGRPVDAVDELAERIEHASGGADVAVPHARAERESGENRPGSDARGAPDP